MRSGPDRLDGGSERLCSFFFSFFFLAVFVFLEVKSFRMLLVPLQALAKGKDFHDQGPDCQVRANTIIVWLCDVTSSQLRSGDVDNRTSLQHVKLALHAPKPKGSCRRASQISDFSPVADAEQEWSGHSCKWHITEPTNVGNYQVFLFCSSFRQTGL